MMGLGNLEAAQKESTKMPHKLSSKKKKKKSQFLMMKKHAY